MGAGLFQTLDALTAEAASHAPCAGAPTIAAHCAHLAYYVRVNHNYAMGREQRVDCVPSAGWRIAKIQTAPLHRRHTIHQRAANLIFYP